MIHKSLLCYSDTISIKAQASLRLILDKMGFLKSYQQKQSNLFSQLYETPCESITWDTSYVSYAYFENQKVYEQHLFFDAKGVAQTRNDLKQDYSPLIAAHYGLVCYNDFIWNQNQDALKSFWIQVKHLQEIGIQDDTNMYFFYKTGIPYLNIQAPWYAGITQGIIGSLFVRAYALTKDPIYARQAEMILNAMFKNLSESGCYTTTPTGYEWIEEYPSVTHPNFVLNGFLFSIISLHEYLQLVGHHPLFAEKLPILEESLFKNLHLYRFGNLWRYSLGILSFGNVEYQGLFVCLWLHLFRLTGKSGYQDIARIFEKGVSWKAFNRFYRMKNCEQKVHSFYNFYNNKIT
jgi:D-glucuronyl C5-epimerase C-terminus